METVKSIYSAAGVFGKLYERWQDEHEYEDFADYKTAMANALPEGATLTKMTKRPFRVEYTQADGVRKWIAVRGNEITWGGYN